MRQRSRAIFKSVENKTDKNYLKKKQNSQNWLDYCNQGQVIKKIIQWTDVYCNERVDSFIEP